MWKWEQLPWTNRVRPSFCQFVYSTEKLKNLVSKETFVGPECIFNWRRCVTRCCETQVPGWPATWLSIRRNFERRLPRGVHFPNIGCDSSRTGHNWTPFRLDIGWICTPAPMQSPLFFISARLALLFVSPSIFVFVLFFSDFCNFLGPLSLAKTTKKCDHATAFGPFFGPKNKKKEEISSFKFL